jgi:VanZ family protein
LLVWRALRHPATDDPRNWSWRLAGRALLWVMLYAATDEFHQLFVPSREAAVTDVLIDTAGGALALCLLWSIGHWRRRTQ